MKEEEIRCLQEKFLGLQKELTRVEYENTQYKKQLEDAKISERYTKRLSLSAVVT